MFGLAGLGIGLGGQLAGGLIENLGIGTADETAGAVSSTGSQMNNVIGETMQTAADKMPQFMRQANYNAMGLSGDAARSDAAIHQGLAGRAYSGDVMDAARQRGTADQMRSLAFDDSAKRMSSMAMENSNRDLRNTAGLAGSGNPALLASLSKQGGMNAMQNANAMQATTAQQASQNLMGAGQMDAQAQAGMANSRGQFYQQNVVPHLNQMQDIGGIMGSALSAGTNVAAQSLGQADKYMSNPLSAVGAGLAGGGTEFMKSSLLGILNPAGERANPYENAGATPSLWDKGSLSTGLTGLGFG